MFLRSSTLRYEALVPLLPPPPLRVVICFLLVDIEVTLVICPRSVVLNVSLGADDFLPGQGALQWEASAVLSSWTLPTQVYLGTHSTCKFSFAV